jgi:hypothetical protein
MLVGRNDLVFHLKETPLADIKINHFNSDVVKDFSWHPFIVFVDYKENECKTKVLKNRGGITALTLNETLYNMLIQERSSIRE